MKISDFGISKRWVGTALRTNCGTAIYRSPEQLGILPRPIRTADNSYTNQVDIWALGAILHEMLTLRIPFLDTYTHEDSGFPSTVEDTVDTGQLYDYCRGKTTFPCDTLRSHGVPEVGIEFVKSLMAANPSERLSAAAALASEWLAEKSSTDGPTSPELVIPSSSPVAPSSSFLELAATESAPTGSIYQADPDPSPATSQISVTMQRNKGQRIVSFQADYAIIPPAKLRSDLADDPTNQQEWSSYRVTMPLPSRTRTASRINISELQEVDQALMDRLDDVWDRRAESIVDDSGNLTESRTTTPEGVHSAAYGYESIHQAIPREYRPVRRATPPQFESAVTGDSSVNCGELDYLDYQESSTNRSPYGESETTSAPYSHQILSHRSSSGNMSYGTAQEVGKYREMQPVRHVDPYPNQSGRPLRRIPSFYTTGEGGQIIRIGPADSPVLPPSMPVPERYPTYSEGYPTYSSQGYRTYSSQGEAGSYQNATGATLPGPLVGESVGQQWGLRTQAEAPKGGSYEPATNELVPPGSRPPHHRQQIPPGATRADHTETFPSGGIYPPGTTSSYRTAPPGQQQRDRPGRRPNPWPTPPTRWEGFVGGLRKTFGK